MLREQILNIQDRKVEPVEVPEWNGTVHVRTFTGSDRARLMQLHKKNADNPAELNTHLVVMACCDEQGNPIFTEADFDQLNGKAATAIDKVAVAALKLNGLDGDSIQAAKNA